jgi:acetaldehyde dehydrogenase / alcohol dehydrogenase
MIVDNDLLSMQQARILAENAREAQHALAAFPQEALDSIVEAMAEAVASQARALAVMSQEETDCGRWQDKQFKNLFVCGKVREQLHGLRCVGVVQEDPAQQVMKIGVPVGVLAVLCSGTSPVSTTAYTALIAVKSGNAAVFAPHPRAQKSTRKVLEIMTEAALSHGLPEGCLSCLGTVTTSGAVELMQHPATAMILLAGSPGLLLAARNAGKPVICGGTGNGPAFIERTADIRQAVRDIIQSKTFDYGLAPSAEQSIVVDACIAGEVRSALQAQGGYFMAPEESQALAAVLFGPNGRRRKGMIGVSAAKLASRAGIAVPEATTVLLADRRYVCAEDPYSRELLAPVLAFYVEDDWMHACEKCIELLLHEHNAHTLVIHSRDDQVIRQFALKKPVGRMLVNTPGALGGMGATTNLFPSLLLGNGAAGRGIAADNITPQHLTYTRTVGFGVRQAPAAPVESILDGRAISSTTLQALSRLFSEAAKVMDGPAG